MAETDTSRLGELPVDKLALGQPSRRLKNEGQGSFLVGSVGCCASKKISDANISRCKNLNFEEF